MAGSKKFTPDEPLTDSSETAPTPEERDEETIRQFLNTSEEQAGDDDVESEDTEEEGAGEEESEEEVEEEPEEEEEEAEEEEESLPLEDLSDEDLELFLEAFEERLLNSPKIQKKLEERARQEAERRFEERLRAEQTSKETELIISQGRQAVESIYNVFNRLRDAASKLAEGEEVNESDLQVDPNELMQHLGAFGAAAVAETRRTIDNAFSIAFREGVTSVMPLTEEEKNEVVKIVQTAQRIANDPRQGQDKATEFLFTESVKLLVQRAKEAGRKEALAEVKKKQEALKRITSENALKAAVARVASTRKKLPPRTPGQAPQSQSIPAKPTLEDYRAAKAAGDYERADAILAAMARP
jgi:hypothetical protein